jgi:hypothetical protein
MWGTLMISGDQTTRRVATGPTIESLRRHSGFRGTLSN